MPNVGVRRLATATTGIGIGLDCWGLGGGGGGRETKKRQTRDNQELVERGEKNLLSISH